MQLKGNLNESDKYTDALPGTQYNSVGMLLFDHPG